MAEYTPSDTITKRNDLTASILQLQQLTSVTWDGNIISKDARDSLVLSGHAQRSLGWNWITASGVAALVKVGYLKP